MSGADALIEALVKIEDLTAKLSRSESARREAEAEIDHWRVKARCYGDIVHGCSPALAAAGFLVDATQNDGAVGGIARSVNALASALASERAARESWEREFNVANTERLRLHDEVENLVERIGQFEAAGFPNVSVVLDRVEADRAAREAAERELAEAIRPEDWFALLREIAKLDTEDGGWDGCDDATFSEQFDPWTTLRQRVPVLRAAESRLSRATEALRPFVDPESYSTAEEECRLNPAMDWCAVHSFRWPCPVEAARAALAEIGGER